MKIKQIITFISIITFIILLIPTILVIPFKQETVSGKHIDEEAQLAASPINDSNSVSIAVYRSERQVIEQLPLEQYVVGVVASEMPATFELEALKAQALAARTYIVKQLLTEDKLGLPEGATVTDTELHQVYKNDEQLKSQWANKYKENYRKIVQAVNETAGQILTYNGEPIAAQYFSTSNGQTENSEAYWSNPFEYLKSVTSPWDIDSPKFHNKTTISVSEFEQLLNIKLSESNDLGKVIERTPGQRVGKITIAGKTFTGREIREKLQLQSADFEWSRKGDQILIKTRGYGHGVGMSQYGANGMALEGKTYEEIVKHYYKGVDIKESDSFINKTVAKN